jgi:hypothetical protein
MDDRVTYGRPYRFILGGIYPEKSHAFSFNLEGAEDINDAYPSYNSFDLKDLLQVRSKAFIALERGAIKETIITEGSYSFRVWHLKNDAPIVIPSDVLEEINNLPKDKDLGIPVAIKVVRGAVQHQPVQLWILSDQDEAKERSMFEARNRLTSWINVSRRWWVESETKQPDLKDLVVASIQPFIKEKA